MPTPRPNETRDAFISRCVPIALKERGTKSPEHAVAKCDGIYDSHNAVNNQKRDVLRGDPSRTKLLRDTAQRDMRVRFRRILTRIKKLLVEEDALGLRPKNQVTNTRWQFRTDEEKVKEFDAWLRRQISSEILTGIIGASGNVEWVEKAYKKGAETAFKGVTKRTLKPQLEKPISVFEGQKEQFIQSFITGPQSVRKVKLLQARVLTDLKNTTEDMAKRLEVVLVDGLIQGKQPYAMIEDVQKAMGVSAFRAETIARTEIIRANAEGNLDAMEALGVEEVGVLVEWSTAGDQRVCGLCSALDGITLKIKEAHNLLPRHPNCRCAFIPANVGEDDAGQARSKEEVEDRLAESIRREKVGITPEEARQQSKWGGADFEPEKKTPEEMGDKAPTSKDQADLSAALDRVVAGLQAAKQRPRQ